MASNIERSLKLLRKAGYLVDKTEHWQGVPGHHGKRKDLFGFGDLLAITDDSTIAVQVTSIGSKSEHLKKLRSEYLRESVRTWLNGPYRRLILLCWEKQNKCCKNGNTRQVWCAFLYELFRDEDCPGGVKIERTTLL